LVAVLGEEARLGDAVDAGVHVLRAGLRVGVEALVAERVVPWPRPGQAVALAKRVNAGWRGATRHVVDMTLFT
jgi:hypothetical protein